MLLVKRQNNNALSGSVLREKLISGSHKRSMRIWTHNHLTFQLKKRVIFLSAEMLHWTG